MSGSGSEWKMAAALILGLSVGVLLWLTVPREEVLGDGPCDQARSTFERVLREYDRQLQEYDRRLHDPDELSGGELVHLFVQTSAGSHAVIDWDLLKDLEEEMEEQAERQDQHRKEQQRRSEWVEEPFFKAFSAVEMAAVVAGQNPECFSAEERGNVEHLYRAGQRAMDRR